MLLQVCAKVGYRDDLYAKFFSITETPLHASPFGRSCRRSRKERLRELFPARRERSTAASVCPSRSRTPPGRATRPKTCPGLIMSLARERGSASILMVRARSCAETPVVTPRAALTETVKLTPVFSLFSPTGTMRGEHQTACLRLGYRGTKDASAVLYHRPYRGRRGRVGGDIEVALILARFGLSRIMSILPLRTSVTASGIEAKGIHRRDMISIIDNAVSAASTPLFSFFRVARSSASARS